MSIKLADNQFIRDGKIITVETVEVETPVHNGCETVDCRCPRCEETDLRWMLDELDYVLAHCEPNGTREQEAWNAIHSAIYDIVESCREAGLVEMNETFVL